MTNNEGTSRNPRCRRSHRFPACPATGKRRFGERKDAKLALKAAARARSVAELQGVRTARRECRAYRCESCHGYHMTSMKIYGQGPKRAEHDDGSETT